MTKSKQKVLEKEEIAGEKETITSKNNDNVQCKTDSSKKEKDNCIDLNLKVYWFLK